MIACTVLLSLFMQVNAAEDIVISVEDFLDEFARRFHDKRLLSENFKIIPIRPAPTDHLVTIHMEKFKGYGPELFLSRRLLSGEDKIRTFKIYDPNHIFFTEDGNFALNNFEDGIDTDTVNVRKAKGGTRTVGIYECRGNKLCFKQWPEAPGCEVAFYRMYCAANSSQYRENLPIPASEVILMNGQVFLVAEFMNGESLKSILTKVSEKRDYANRYVFDLDRFQALVIFCLIAAPEDCRPENILVRPIKDSDKCEFALIDNERSFGEQITVFHDSGEGLIRTRMHCALFCFHEMLRKKINEDTYRRITSQQFAEDIFRAVEGLRSISVYQAALAANIPDVYKGKSNLAVPFGKDAISGMYKRLERFTSTASDRSKGLADIIVNVSPEIAHIYELDKRYISLSSILQTKPPHHELVPELIKVLELLRKTDHRRFSGPTPLSAYVPLRVYFGSPVASPTISPGVSPPLSASASPNAPKSFMLPPSGYTQPLSSAQLSLSRSSLMSISRRFASSGPTDRGALDGQQPQLDFLELLLVHKLSLPSACS